MRPAARALRLRPLLIGLLFAATALAGCTTGAPIAQVGATPGEVSVAGPSTNTSTSTTSSTTTTTTGTATSTSTTTATTTTTTTTTTSTTTTAPAPPQWGDPAKKTLRPGINMLHDGASCTTSFLFHHEWTDYYLATAAHCVGPGDVSEGCDRKSTMPTASAELRLTDGSTVSAPVAYHSWTTMMENKESDRDTCLGNDFALLALPPSAVAVAHPASLHFRAPTGLATSATDDLWGYGASPLKLGVSQAHPKQGIHLGSAYSGWSHHVYLVTPGIPGDSGGHILTEDGQALGIASTVSIAPVPGSNHYTDIAKALDYMRLHEGWAPELVTWNDFHASLT